MKIKDEVDARKQVLQGDEIWHLLSTATGILVASGKKIEKMTPQTAIKADLVAKVSGRTGNLRAPALRKGDVYYIGYNDALYDLIATL